MAGSASEGGDMKISREFLRAKNACADGFKWFCERFDDGGIEAGGGIEGRLGHRGRLRDHVQAHARGWSAYLRGALLVAPDDGSRAGDRVLAARSRYGRVRRAR